MAEINPISQGFFSWWVSRVLGIDLAGGAALIYHKGSKPEVQGSLMPNPEEHGFRVRLL
jgi:hypothetical protein